MSLRSIALAYLESQKKPNDCKLSQRDIPKGVPAGQMAFNHSKSNTYSVPAHVPYGTVKTDLNYVGTGGTPGTSGTDHWMALQAEADRRNAKVMREHSTARYCRCGSLAECAWPLEGRRELWRCFRCLEPIGAA